MTAKKLFEMIGDADAELIADASGESIRRKHPAWLRWGAAAACICILAAGALGIFLHPAVNGGGYAPGGSWPEGVDPKMASIAVYPATEKVQDVADATLRTLSEEEARQFEDLGKYLPRTLPEGYWFVISEVRETTMKDGSVYHLLRATYSRSDPADFDPEYPYLTDDCFMLQVLDYPPKTKIKIYTPEKLKLSKTGQDNFYLALDKVYIGVFPQNSIEGDDLRQLVEDLTNK